MTNDLALTADSRGERANDSASVQKADAFLQTPGQMQVSSQQDKFGQPACSDSTAALASHSSSPAGSADESAVESAAEVSRLDGFLHTVTTADEVLNELLGELSYTSSFSSPLQISRQPSSSALYKLTGQQPDDASIHKIQLSSSASAPADAALWSSSVAGRQAHGVPASSSAHGHAETPESFVHSPRSTTDLVLDTLLDDLRSAERARQSSSSVLLSSLNSLAEMRRRSASSSPVAGQPADVCLPSSSPSLSASNALSRQSSSFSVGEASSSPSSSIPQQQASSSLQASSNNLSVSQQHPDEPLLSTAAEQNAESDRTRSVRDEEEGAVGRLQRVSTSDMVLEGILDGAELAPEPDSAAVKVHQVSARLFLCSGKLQKLAERRCVC